MPVPDGFIMHQGCFGQDWIFRYGKKLSLEGCSGANGYDKEYVNWVLDNEKAVQVRRPRGIPKEFVCVRKYYDTIHPEIYCVGGNIKEYLE